jgi:hypothetical protein
MKNYLQTLTLLMKKPVRSCTFDSDDCFKEFEDDDFGDNWERLDMCAPDICHTCRFIGHSHQKCPDIGKVKARNIKYRQNYCEVADTMNRKNLKKNLSKSSHLMYH